MTKCFYINQLLPLTLPRSQSSNCPDRYRCSGIRRRPWQFQLSSTFTHSGRSIDWNPLNPSKFALYLSQNSCLRINDSKDENSIDISEKCNHPRSSKLESEVSTITNVTVTNVESKTDWNTTTKDDATKSISNCEWQSNDFENDYRLLRLEIARRNSIYHLQQLQRKYTLDYGFASNRRPLIKDLILNFFKVSAWTYLLTRCGADTVIQSNFFVMNESMPWSRKVYFFVTKTIISMTIIHHIIVGVFLPLCMLIWANCEKNLAGNRADALSAQKKKMIKKWKLPSYGPSAKILDSFFHDRQDNHSSISYRFVSKAEKMKQREETTDFVLCLLENWSSAIILFFLSGLFSMCASVANELTPFTVMNAERLGIISTSLQKLFSLISASAFSRLLTRVGAAAALHQYPSLLFELRRKDQPRPLCRPTVIMQFAVNSFLRYLPLGISSDLALLLGAYVNRKKNKNTINQFVPSVGCLLSITPPLCHIIALLRIVRISKCSAITLSEETSFPNAEGGIHGFNYSNSEEDKRKLTWRYQLRWRTPQRLRMSIWYWAIIFFTGHVPLFMDMDECLNRNIRSNNLSTEGILLLPKRMDQERDKEKSRLLKDEITESLSLIFRDRDASIVNATETQRAKHQQSFDDKSFNDVLGVAIQQTFGIGLSYDFDHFSIPGEKISVNQLRARMAKSAIQRKIKLENTMIEKLESLRRISNNISLVEEPGIKEKIQSLEQNILDKYNSKIDRIKHALLTTIPTDAEAPTGTERFDNPILVAKFVNTSAPIEEPIWKVNISQSSDKVALITDEL